MHDGVARKLAEEGSAAAEVRTQRRTRTSRFEGCASAAAEQMSLLAGTRGQCFREEGRMLQQSLRRQSLKTKRGYPRPLFSLSISSCQSVMSMSCYTVNQIVVLVVVFWIDRLIIWFGSPSSHIVAVATDLV